jgi:uroporphyrinogen-III synthase
MPAVMRQKRFYKTAVKRSHKRSEMEDKGIHILSTRPLPAGSTGMARDKGILIDEVSFIQTIPMEFATIERSMRKVLNKQATVVFTSMNAVESVSRFLNGQLPVWNIYCIGNTTLKEVKKYFGAGSVAGTAGNARELAALILEKNTSPELYFFCGSQRRDELPDMLRQKGTVVKEVEVYKTVPLPREVHTRYNGILFYSPSAVQSFFSVNATDEGTVFFAIGETTAGEIRKHTRNKVIVSPAPGKENLVEQVVGYFCAD